MKKRMRYHEITVTFRFATSGLVMSDDDMSGGIVLASEASREGRSPLGWECMKRDMRQIIRDGISRAIRDQMIAKYGEDRVSAYRDRNGDLDTFSTYLIAAERVIKGLDVSTVSFGGPPKVRTTGVSDREFEDDPWADVVIDEPRQGA